MTAAPLLARLLDRVAAEAAAEAWDAGYQEARDDWHARGCWRHHTDTRNPHRARAAQLRAAPAEAPAGRTGDSGSEVRGPGWRPICNWDQCPEPGEHRISTGSCLIAPCPTCMLGSRETVGMVCQTCGTDYGYRTAEERLAAVLALHVPYDDPTGQLCEHDEFRWPCGTYIAAGAS